MSQRKYLIEIWNRNPKRGGGHSKVVWFLVEEERSASCSKVEFFAEPRLTNANLMEQVLPFWCYCVKSDRDGERIQNVTVNIEKWVQFYNICLREKIYWNLYFVEVWSPKEVRVPHQKVSTVCTQYLANLLLTISSSLPSFFPFLSDKTKIASVY